MRYTTIFVAALASVAGRVAAQGDNTDTANATATDGNAGATATPTAEGAEATSTGFPQCATNCALNAIASSGCAVTDVNCICASPFIAAINTCVSVSCNPTDHASALEAASAFCANAGPVQSVSASASSAVASITSAAASSRAAVTPAAASAAAAAHSSVSQSRSSASVVSASASASHSGNAATAVKKPSASFLALGATALGFVVGPLLLFA
ncbi:hypothetical protein FRC04_000586 [Tulasnella sp. 424]|nr:hypothetical protein FRC04_000586 [Tulasnella sp. 424]KAG8967896.1 hypothetical protein FRC05_001861 [Tulasnella sp. 425]